MERLNSPVLSLMVFTLYGLLAIGSVGCQKSDSPPTGDLNRCQTTKDEMSVITVSGKILSSESSCQAPLTDKQVNLHLSCLNSNQFDTDPFVAWKTGKDGSFKASIPFQAGASFVRLELCLAARRSCRPLILELPEPKSSPGDPSLHQVTSDTSISVAVQTVTEQVKVGSKGKEMRANLCLGEKKRKRRLASWDDRDISWLRKKSGDEKMVEEVGAKSPGKRGWSNGIPWLKRSHHHTGGDSEKRLWEGADEEVGWIKRHSLGGQSPSSELNGKLPDEEQSRHGVMEDYTKEDPSTIHHPGKRRLTKDARQSLATRGSGLPPARWPQPEEMKKYWAESDMSWL